MGNQGFRQGTQKDTYFSIGEAEFAVAKGLEEQKRNGSRVSIITTNQIQKGLLQEIAQKRHSILQIPFSTCNF